MATDPKTQAPTTEQIAAHVRYRLGRFAQEPIVFAPSLLSQKESWGHRPPPRRLSALTTHEKPRYLPLNGFDRMMRFQEGAFRTEHEDPVQRRRAFFGNEFLRAGVSTDFLLNPCDAQGWDYPAVWPALKDAPVLQYCRLAQQRDQVALVPLFHTFAGPGSPNLPLGDFDTLSFRQKRPMVTWRGRMSGTQQGDSSIRWLEGEFRAIAGAPEAAEPAAIDALFRFPRPAIAQRLVGSPWADIKMVLTQREVKMLGDKTLPPELACMFGDRQSREEQLASRYILCIDGNDVATGLYWALLSNSLVFKASTGWETILDYGLKPWVHFVPVAPDGSDIEERFTQCEADPAMCEEIIANASQAMQWALDSALRQQIDVATLRRYEAALEEGRQE